MLTQSRTFAPSPPRLVFPSTGEVLSSAQGLPLAPLVGVEAQKNILELGRGLALPVQTACYECRLAEHDDRVDLALCILPPYADPKRFAKALAELIESHRGHREWERTASFLEKWASQAPGYRPEFPFVWLAFDLEEHLRALPVPCPAPCVDPDFFARRLGATLAPRSASELETMADTCHQAFVERPLSGDVRDRFLRCLSVPGVNVQAKHFSFMLSRRPNTFKLDVQLPVDQIAQYLHGIGWPGPAREIEARIRHYMPWPGNVQLNLVLSPNLTGPLEVEFLSGGQDITPSERFGFLRRLVETSLCSPEKAGVLRDTWERRLLPASDTCENAIAVNWYVKIRFQEDVATEAKAYVGLMPRLRSGLGARNQETAGAS